MAQQKKKKKKTTKKNAPVPQTGTTGTTTTLSFGCLAGVCVATNPFPLHLGPAGSYVYMCALNSGVDIKFTGNSPFVSGNRNFSIPAGNCTQVETVAPANPGTRFKFTLRCATGCPTPAGAPEMIVP
jgi:hypothetical protein